MGHHKSEIFWVYRMDVRNWSWFRWILSWFSTTKTPENVKAFKEEIKKLVLNGEQIEGTYRKAEPDSSPVSHFYDSKIGKTAILKKQTKEFVSAWNLTEGQI